MTRPANPSWKPCVAFFRDLLLALLAAGALYALATWAWRAAAARPLEGDLVVENFSEPREAVVGPFHLRFDPSSRVLTIREQEGGRELWASLPGRAFIGAAQGQETVRETRGSYHISDSLRARRARQTVSAVLTGGGVFTLRGSLGSGGSAQPLDYTLSFRVLDDHRLGFTLSTTGPANRLFFTYAAGPNEQFFGFGEQFSYLNHTGKRVPIWVSEQGIGRGLQPLTTLVNLVARSGGNAYTTYAAVPHYITSHMRSLYLENSEYSIFDLRRARRVQLQLWSSEMRGAIVRGSTPAELVSAYTAYSGRMRILPDWILEGAVVGMQGGTAPVRSTYARLKALQTPISAFWLQDWVGQRATSFGQQLWWNWELDPERYPAWENLTRELQQDGVRVMLYASPFLADVSAKPNARRNLYQEAARLGYLVQDSSGRPYAIQNTSFSAGLVDLTHPQARAWYQGVLRDNLLGAGASGWMADFGEALPYDAVLRSGTPAPVFHNAYPAAWAQFNREFIDSSPHGSELVFFTRSGFSTSPAFSTLFWAGDQLVSWDAHDGIQSALTGMLSGGISGMSFNHSDIGGYTTIDNPLARYHRSKELLLRWMDFAAFTPIYRTHEGNIPALNAQFYSDDESLAHFSRMARVYAAWAGTRKALVREAAETGLPVMRPLFFAFPQDPNTYHLTTQYLLGADLLVAPALDPGRDSVRAYLPSGAWVHLWSGQTHQSPAAGSWVAVPAPLGQPPVFYPPGSAAGNALRANLSNQSLLEE